MNLSYDTHGSLGVVKVHCPRLDAALAIQFKDQFGAIALTGPAEGDATILLDLEEVEFLDSSGLGAIVAARKMLGTDRTLALAALSPAVDKVMRLTHMNRIFPIFESVAACTDGQDRSETV